MRDPYPLQWPDGWPRSRRRERSAFKVASFSAARDRLLRGIHLLGGVKPVITSNLPTRYDGLPYANAGEPADSGIAVYWVQDGKEKAMACDRWARYRDNLHAIELSISALRGLSRWGTSTITERAFAGFAALPPSPDDWRSVFGYLPNETPSVEMVKQRYRMLATHTHPDTAANGGGSHEAMVRLNLALAMAERDLA